MGHDFYDSWADTHDTMPMVSRSEFFARPAVIVRPRCTYEETAMPRPPKPICKTPKCDQIATTKGSCAGCWSDKMKAAWVKRRAQKQSVEASVTTAPIEEPRGEMQAEYDFAGGVRGKHAIAHENRPCFNGCTLKPGHNGPCSPGAYGIPLGMTWKEFCAGAAVIGRRMLVEIDSMKVQTGTPSVTDYITDPGVRQLAALPSDLGQAILTLVRQDILQRSDVDPSDRLTADLTEYLTSEVLAEAPAKESGDASHD